MRAAAGALLCAAAAHAFSPLQPAAGWAYLLEVSCGAQWPASPSRFLAPSADPGRPSTLSSARGPAQQLRLTAAPNGTWYLGTGNRWLSYAGDCANPVLDSWPQAGVNQQFRLVPGSSPFLWRLEAVQRGGCAGRWAEGTCGVAQPAVALGDKGAEWWLHPVEGPDWNHTQNTPDPCADPYMWREGAQGAYRLLCTGGMLPLYGAAELGPRTVMQHIGSALGGHPSGWAASGARWAPESIPRPDGGAVMVVCDQQPSGEHRIGWVGANGSAAAGAWRQYAPNYLELGTGDAGDIDAHLFRDSNGSLYLLWKTDDNRVGKQVTRIWARQVGITPGGGLALQGPGRVILDSAGLWWADSFVPGGALVEGPEIVKRGDWYYLFFAAGRFCQESYSEGVARSRSLWGPYEKLAVPLLSTPMVGSAGGRKIVGPGHASYPADPAGDPTLIVWHGSPAGDCTRHAYVDRLQWLPDGAGGAEWPRVDFTPV